MTMFRFSLWAIGIGILSLIGSALAASQIEQAKRYHYPESLARHYLQRAKGKASIRIVDSSQPFTLEIPVSEGSTAGDQIADTLEIETVETDVIIEPQGASDDGSKSRDAIDVSLPSGAVDADPPILVDRSLGKTIRLRTDESALNDNSAKGTLVFNFLHFDSDGGGPGNALKLKVPASIRHVKVRTISGEVEASVRGDSLDVQSKSGGLILRTPEGASLTDLRIATVSGDSDIFASCKNLRLDSISGDVDVALTDSLATAELKTVSGDVTLHADIPLHASGSSEIQFSSMSGNVELSDETTKHGRRGKRPETVTLPVGSAKLRIETVSGDLHVSSAAWDSAN